MVPATSKVTQTRVKAVSVCVCVCAPNLDIKVPQAICITCVSNYNNKRCMFHTFQHPIAYLCMCVCVCVCVVHSVTISKMHAMHFNYTVVIVKGEWVTAVATVATLVCVCVCVWHTRVCVCVFVCVHRVIRVRMWASEQKHLPKDSVVKKQIQREKTQHRQGVTIGPLIT